MTAILFGSISTVADTSELQRDAFNQAFARHGLDWTWDQDDYRERLAKSGGADRVSEYAAERGITVDAAAIHATKSEIFQASLATASLTPRAGVVETIRDAKANGAKVGLVTTTSAENVSALLAGLSPELGESDFDVVVDLGSVSTPKPDGAAYAFALTSLGETAESAVAIEDNVDGVKAAQAANVRVVAFPNENTSAHDFGSADRVDHVSFDELKQAS